MKHRTSVFLANIACFLCLVGIAFCLLVWALGWPRRSDDGSDKRLDTACRNEFAAARERLDAAVEDLRQGKDEEAHFESFRARMEPTLLFCFPSDNAPEGLLQRRHVRPTVQELQGLAAALDDGWKKSVVGQSWKGIGP